MPDTEDERRVDGRVGQIHGHTVTLFDAVVIEPRSDLPCFAVKIGVGQVDIRGPDGRFFWPLGHLL
ncbi:MAG: hypothetical protein J07HX64_00005 [halophilic archaeon J07HX64]|nr:MAG: hypothetical protein J07HX64_00005 [halophilic archaeon J07HX64]